VANFNAGAIEGTLTLDRSPFNKDLKEAMAMAKKFEQEKIKIPLEIEGLEKLDELKAKLDAIGDETVNIELDVDNADAISELQARLDEIRDETVTIEVDIDDASIGRLEAELKAIPDETVTVEVDTDEGVSALRRLAGERNHIQGSTLAIGALIAILPAVVPVALSAAAAVGALVSATSILAAGLGAFALIAIPAWKNYTKAVKEAGGDMSKLSPQMRALKAEQDNLSDAFKSFGSNNRIYAVIGGGMRLIATVLQQIKPLVDVVTIAVSQLVTQMILFAQSPAFKQVVAFLTANFIPVFKLVTQIMGNLIQFIGGITGAFAPFAQEFLGGIEHITAAWANWAKSLSTSKKFQDFLNYVRETGPKVIDLFRAVSNALGNIGAALAPIGGPVLDALIRFFDFLGNMNTSVLGALVVGIGTFTVAVIAATAAMAAFDAVAALNPFVAIALAIIALVAAFVYLWKTNEGFRNFFINTWNAIWGFMKAVGAWFAGPFAGFFVAGFNGLMTGVRAVANFFTTIWNGIKTGVQAVGNFFVSVWNFITSTVSAAVNIIAGIISTGIQIFLAPIKLFINVVTAIWGAFWGVFGELIKAAWGLVAAVIQFGVGVALALIQGWLKITMQVVTATWAAIKGFLVGTWNAISGVARAVWGAIQGFVIGSWNALKSAATSVWNAIKSAVTTAINAVKGPVSSAVNAVKDKVTSIWNSIKSTTSSVWNSLKDVIGKAIDAAKSKVSSVVDSIKGIFSGAGSWLISAGRAIIQGLIDGIQGMIGKVTAKLKELTDKIPKVKGPEEVDKKLLRPAGQWIMEGFNSELEKGIDQALSTLGGFTGQIPTVAQADSQLALTPNVASRVTGAGGALSRDEFIALMSELIRQIQNNTQPLIGEYHANDKDPKEIAEEWWLITKGRG
jgi:phage-related protein